MISTSTVIERAPMPTAIVSMGNAAIIAWTFSLFTAAAGPCSLYVEPLLPHMVISYGNISYFMDETTTAPSADNAAAWVDSKEMATRAAAKIMEEATA